MKAVVQVVVCVALLALSGRADAEPRSVLVLPLDGDAAPELRARLNAAIEKLAKTSADQVTVGDTTFTETAAAIGCVREDAGCAENVRTTLGVDELVHGTVAQGPDGTTVVVYRAIANGPARSITTVLAPAELPEKAEVELAPLFGAEQASEVPAADLSLHTELAPARSMHHQRTKGILVTAGGGLALVIGFALWANKSAVQSDINAAPTATAEDFARLEELESRASTYAMAGNVMVLAGLALTGYGGWILYDDHKSRQLAITPAVTPTTAGVSLGGTW